MNRTIRIAIAGFCAGIIGACIAMLIGTQKYLRMNARSVEEVNHTRAVLYFNSCIGTKPEVRCRQEAKELFNVKELK